MEQDNLTITLKQKNNNNEEQVQNKKIPDDYPTLDRAGQVTLICLHTGHNRLNSHMNRRVNLVPSPTTLFRARTGSTMYVWNRRSNNRTNTENMSIIPTSHRTDMVRRNIRSCM